MLDSLNTVTIYDRCSEVSRGNPIIYLRVPDEIRERIKREAEANGRTMTGEVVFRLRSAYGMGADEEKERPKKTT